MKINFERYMDELMRHELAVQPMLIPQVLELTVDDYAVWLNDSCVFTAAPARVKGVRGAQPEHPGSAAVLSAASAESYFKAILDNLKAVRSCCNWVWTVAMDFSYGAKYTALACQQVTPVPASSIVSSNLLSRAWLLCTRHIFARPRWSAGSWSR